jgi:hypothetical protein
MQFGPVAPIIAAIIGALITAGVSYLFVHKRRQVSFWVRRTANLTEGLKPYVSLSVEGSEVHALNRAAVVVVNSGNSALKDFEFEVRIPGHHGVCAVKAESSDALLEKAVKVVKSYSSVSEILVNVVVPFFNPKEVFEVVLFFDNEPDECEVRCRMEDTSVKVRRGFYVPRPSVGEIAKMGMVPLLAMLTTVGLISVIVKIVSGYFVVPTLILK